MLRFHNKHMERFLAVGYLQSNMFGRPKFFGFGDFLVGFSYHVIFPKNILGPKWPPF